MQPVFSLHVFLVPSSQQTGPSDPNDVATSSSRLTAKSPATWKKGITFSHTLLDNAQAWWAGKSHWPNWSHMATSALLRGVDPPDQYQLNCHLLQEAFPDPPH